MVDAPVMIFICSDGQDDVSHHGGLPQFPVVDSYLGCGQDAPHRQLSLVDLLENVGVGDDGLLLQVANKPDCKYYNCVGAGGATCGRGGERGSRPDRSRG